MNLEQEVMDIIGECWYVKEAFRVYIRHTAELTRDCKSEYIFRDIYALNGNIEKVKRAVEIVREETEK